MTSDSSVRNGSYEISIPGRLKANMPTKCIDQMPPPMAIAAAASQAPRARPDVARIRVARSSAVYEASAAISIDSATRTGS